MRTRSFLVVALLATTLMGCKSELYKGLSQREANEMIAVLLDGGIEAERQMDGGSYRIMIDPSLFSRAVKTLSAAGYPRASFRSIEEVFPGDRMILTPFEQKTRLRFALGQELAKTVSSLPGIVSAQVHVVLPDSDIRGQLVAKTTASVLIRVAAGTDTAPLVAQVKMLVSNAVQGLSYQDVVVIALDNATRSEGQPPAVQSRL